MRRRPDAATKWLLRDFEESGLPLGEWETERGIILDELPLPSPAAQRIRRHERSFQTLDGNGRPRRQPRAALRMPKATPAPRGTVSKEMSQARREWLRQERILWSALPCASCGTDMLTEKWDTRITCASCRRQIVELASD